MTIDTSREFRPVGIAVLTVSDTRTDETDTSGRTLVERAQGLGHRIAAKVIVKDDTDLLEAQLRTWVADDSIDVILTTGGTGITGRDVTPEAVQRVLTKEIPGFGELFRWISYPKIGTSTIQSRALGGLAGKTLIFAMPGSTGACKDAWDGILASQLDVRFRPCNFIELLPRLAE
ncbi:MAG: molybdenum cofactor biosynthesis protein B [Proteobacteria bacterium]|nr:molybdenum cofactor biosynthesis protein B [Pseudomonadota bacterium]